LVVAADSPLLCLLLGSACPCPPLCRSIVGHQPLCGWMGTAQGVQNKQQKRLVRHCLLEDSPVCCSCVADIQHNVGIPQRRVGIPPAGVGK
jgi:hypothetical protein